MTVSESSSARSPACTTASRASPTTISDLPGLGRLGIHVARIARADPHRFVQRRTTMLADVGVVPFLLGRRLRRQVTPFDQKRRGAEGAGERPSADRPGIPPKGCLVASREGK